MTLVCVSFPKESSEEEIFKLTEEVAALKNKTQKLKQEVSVWSFNLSGGEGGGSDCFKVIRVSRSLFLKLKTPHS